MKVLFHIDETEKWDLTLTNVRNMVKEYDSAGVDYQIEIVANSAAVRLCAPQAYGHNALASAMADWCGKRVHLAACANALAANQIPADQLPPFVRVVPSGVVELAQKQAEGFVYLKP